MSRADINVCSSTFPTSTPTKAPLHLADFLNTASQHLHHSRCSCRPWPCYSSRRGKRLCRARASVPESRVGRQTKAHKYVGSRKGMTPVGTGDGRFFQWAREGEGSMCGLPCSERLGALQQVCETKEASPRSCRRESSCLGSRPRLGRRLGSVRRVCECSVMSLVRARRILSVLCTARATLTTICTPGCQGRRQGQL